MDHGINEQHMEARKMAAMGLAGSGQRIGSQVGFGKAVYQDRPKETTVLDALYRAVSDFDELDKRATTLVDRMCGESNEAEALGINGASLPRGGLLGTMQDMAETLERRIQRLDTHVRRLEARLPGA